MDVIFKAEVKLDLFNLNDDKKLKNERNKQSLSAHSEGSIPTTKEAQGQPSAANTNCLDKMNSFHFVPRFSLDSKYQLLISISIIPPAANLRDTLTKSADNLLLYAVHQQKCVIAKKCPKGENNFSVALWTSNPV